MTDDDIRELSAFLVEAKRGTYASLGDSATVQPALPGSKQLEHRSGRFLYRDVYFGMNRPGNPGDSVV